jgi:VanZ family protein
VDVRETGQRGNEAAPSQRTAIAWRHKVFVGYVLVMVVVFLLPVPPTPVDEFSYVDKLVHFGIFLGFALLFYLDRHQGAWKTFLIATAFAGGVELLQGILPYRSGDWLDFAAGAAGAGVGAVLLLFSERTSRQHGKHRV